MGAAADSGSCGTVVSFSAPAYTYNCFPYSNTFSYTGAIQSWKVPNGVHRITLTAWGAEGGGANGMGGDGAVMKGNFVVSPGDSLIILVGGTGGMGYGDGGGGGSFVFNVTTNTLLIAAGGGGGAGTECGGLPGGPGLTTTDGGSTTFGSGGTNGMGGPAINFCAGGGAGVLGDGGSASGGGGGGGQAIYLGGAGGAAVTGTFASGAGGYGGGGAGGNRGGGGGGGYSGGAGSANIGGCGEGGGGGGSFNGGSAQNNQQGVRTGNGEVLVEWGDSVTVTQTAGLPSGSVFPVGVTTNTFHYQDEVGNSNNSSFTVSVIDLEAPSVVAPANIKQCYPDTTVTFSFATADNCGIDWALSDFASGSGFPIGTTTVTITAIDIHSNITYSTFTVTIDSLPVVDVNLPVSQVCVDGDSIALNAATPAGGFYSGIGVSNGFFHPATAGSGNASVTYNFTDGNGCTAAATEQITVDTIPVVTLSISDDTLCNGSGAITLTGGLPLGGTYLGTSVSSGMFNPVALGSNTVTYSYIDGNGCSSNATGVITVEICSGIEDIASANIALYPNPASGYVTIRFTESNPAVKIEVTDVTGRLVKVQYAENVTEQRIETASLPTGLYSVRVTTAAGSAVKLLQVNN